MKAGEIIVVTDRPDRSGSLVEEIRSIASCRVVGTDARWDRAGDILGVIADVDLERPEAKKLFGRLAVGSGGGGPSRAPPPLIYLTQSNASDVAAEARRRGATACLPAHSAARVIVGALAKLIWPNRSMAELVACREAEKVGRVLGDMLAVAGARGRIDLQAVDSAAEPVLTAIREGGLGHWLDIVWTHDEPTFQHCLLVAGVTANFARQLSFSASDQRMMTRAALVHDVGKSKIPPAILNKPGRLEPDEMTLMRTHAPLGEDILRASGEADAVMLAVTRHHHEMLDGTGYPDRLSGGQIADPVRLLTICDIYSALVERRSYKAPMPSREALAILDGMSGKLEGGLVQAFAGSVRKIA